MSIRWKDSAAACVVLASDGYPGEYKTGRKIKGLKDVQSDNQYVVHSSTKMRFGRPRTNGGRVLSVVGVESTLDGAIQTAYNGVDKIQFDNKYFRTDIGKKGLLHLA
ncbi:MAG: hypothetical protein HRT90_00050 [Candidatus Margulisbacteria bacterium]|nr:hypothetical protein [Candidatus Margulisiibacteriota bacterium]